MPQTPQPKPCAEQIKALQQANDQRKTALDTQAVHDYFSNIGEGTAVGATIGATSGGSLGVIAGSFTLGVTLPITTSVGVLGGGFLGGITGMGKSAVMGGIQYRHTTDNIQNNWQLNYNSIQNFSNIGCIGDAPPIRY